MPTERILNPRSAPTSRTLAILSCALALLTVSPASPARAACNPNEAAIRPASAPLQSPTWQLASKSTPSLPPAAARNKAPVPPARPNQAQAGPWQTKLLYMQAYLLTALAAPAIPAPEYFLEVPAVVQGAVPFVLRTIPAPTDRINPPPPAIERWFALTHCLLAPPYHA